MVFHLLAPRAMEASRRAFGTERRNSSVLRSVMGIIIRPSANPPDSAEKCLKRGNRNQGAQAGHGQHEAAHKLSPAQPGVHACPIPAPRWEVTTISKRASPLSMKVRRKSTSPNSIRD